MTSGIDNDDDDKDAIATTRWWVGLCFCIAAVGIVTIVGALSERTSVQPVRGWHATAGHITKVDGVCDVDGCSYTATIAFQARGRSFTTQTSLDDAQPKPVVGSVVQLSYDPADPARVHDLSLQRGAWVAYEVIGGVFLLIGLPGAVLCALSVRRQREPDAGHADWAGLLARPG